MLIHFWIHPLSLSIFEPTCANAQWALRSRIPSVCLSVRLWLDKNYWTIIHISGIVWVRVTKFGMAMDIDYIKVIYEGQGHRSKVKVTTSKKSVFINILDKNYWTIIHISETVWDRVTKFWMVMNIDGIKVMYEDQGRRSKVKVTISKKVIFMDSLDKNYWTIIHIS